jgi:hypothetical protein
MAEIQVNIDEIRKTRVHIAMPCYGGMCTETALMSLVKWANAARQLGVDWTIETMVNESLISRARNTLTAKFLEDTSATHLMFIDSDIGWEPWHLLAMIDHNVDMVGGLYPMKTLPVRWVVNGVEGETVSDKGLLKVSKTGTGFLLIKRQVFDVMAQHPSVKPYKNDIGLDPKYDAYLKTYFDTAVREGRYLSEDWTACANFIEMGGAVHVDTRIRLRHTGSYVFCQENQDGLMNTIGPMFAKELIEKGVKIVDSEGKELSF